MDKEELKEKIIELIEQDIEDGEVLPHYGLIADWKIRYMDLAKLIWQYLHVWTCSRHLFRWCWHP